ncbi:MAG: hypothetical protein ACD_24C00031G0002 [uncultured bacterium]|uniref:LytR/CpsA/Psr regulator C-terminal domain-containing protein n=1 Tax=candidate division WWE3 bacterium RBG_16_37_10 TaxID=1802610 RepID=A0A1F4UWL4_UNCKA|nr:MAG: hypothetical protein ACD_24C00031G0002 [uncultured bacterium]OGC49220.1 MAG: hypothetical protein A2W32_00155 [candidate division WWE3 bacterium RBG_16_37_10]
MKINFLNKNKILIGFFGLVFLVTLGSAVYFYDQNLKLKVTSDETAKEDNQKLLSEVGKIIELPSNESPTVAVVSDKEKLSGNVFFKNSQNGDKVLIFAEAKKAILYRPSTKKLIEVANINLADTNGVVAGSKDENVEAAAVKMSVFNGTKEDNIFQDIEDKLKEQKINAEFVTKRNALRDNYIQTLVVDLTGESSESANQIAKALDGQVGSLPKGETKPEGSDILIIAGLNLVK